MADAIAPAAPAAAPTTNGVKPGASARGTVSPTSATKHPPSGSSSAASKPLPGATNGTPAPRANDGKFLTKDGTAGVEQQEGDEAETTEAKAEAYRLKRKLKFLGQEEDVDLDEDGLVQELQRGRIAQKKEAEGRKASAALKRLEDIGKTEDGAYKILAALGHDPAKLAAKLMAQHAQREMMSDEQRAIMERDEKIAAYEEERTQRAESEKKARFEQAVGKAKAQQTALFEQALETIGLPKNQETLLLMAETYRNGGGHRAQYTPQELAQETERRDLERGQRLGKGRTGDSLLRFLGEDVVKEVMRAKLSQYEQRQTATEPPESGQTSNTQTEQPRQRRSMADIAAAMRKLK